MRPFYDLLLHCEDELGRELHQAGLARPSNHPAALAYFERKVAVAIHNALRQVPPLRADRDTRE
jgi:hypothetical protein